jgi:hypothetical protein
MPHERYTLLLEPGGVKECSRRREYEGFCFFLGKKNAVV